MWVSPSIGLWELSGDIIVKLPDFPGIADITLKDVDFWELSSGIGQLIEVAARNNHTRAKFVKLFDQF